MARHDHQQQAGNVHLLQRVEQQHFLAVARAGSKKYRTLLAELRAQLPAQLQHRGRRLDVELEIARHGNIFCAEAAQARGIVGSLRGDGGEFAQRSAGQPRKPRIAACGFFRQARIQQQQRHAACAAGVDQIEPDFRFHQDADLRFEAAQKSLHRKRIIIRQVHAQHAVAIQLLAGSAPGGRGMGEQNLMIGIGCAQPGNKALCGAGLAYRNGVQPDDRLIASHGIKAEALADVMQVFRLPARAPQQAQKNVRQQQPQREAINKS